MVFAGPVDGEKAICQGKTYLHMSQGRSVEYNLSMCTFLVVKQKPIRLSRKSVICFLKLCLGFYRHYESVS